jgi:hypothetical protein
LKDPGATTREAVEAIPCRGKVHSEGCSIQKAGVSSAIFRERGKCSLLKLKKMNENYHNLRLFLGVGEQSTVEVDHRRRQQCR